VINLSFNPKICVNNATPKQEEAKFYLKLNSPLTEDTASFTGRKRTTRKPNSTPINKKRKFGNEPEVHGNTCIISDTKYKNVLEKPLVSVQRLSFDSDLKCRKLTSYYSARMRISSLSRYLKEDMIGFVVPKYEIDGEEKGGYQWFEKGAEYLLRGAKEGKGHGVEERDFKPVAKELYGLLALHDDYWKSPEFVDYLSTLEQTPAIKATIEAVEELNIPKKVSFTGETVLTTYGFFSPLKAIDKLTTTNCAYTGEKFTVSDDPDKHPHRPSLEHIMPKGWGGPCDDGNYILTTRGSNSARGDMGLIDYLRGASNYM